MDPTPVVFRFLGGSPMLAGLAAFGRFVDAEDERREHHFPAVRVAIGDGPGRRPIRMRFNGFGT